MNKENSSLSIISSKVKLGKDVKIFNYVNIYDEAIIGDECIIGAFVEIQPEVVIGKQVKVSSHTFICTGVTLEDEVFIGHGVMFTNDKHPACVDENGNLIRAKNANVITTLVKKGARIGSGCTILPGITIGKNALIGAGSVVTGDVPDGAIAYGNPARIKE